jgi:hypothetical protein
MAARKPDAVAAQKRCIDSCNSSFHCQCAAADDE